MSFDNSNYRHLSSWRDNCAVFCAVTIITRFHFLKITFFFLFSEISRTCLPLPQEEGCTSADGGEVCFCNSDLCNSATHTASRVFWIISLGFLVVLKRWLWSHFKPFLKTIVFRKHFIYLRWFILNCFVS